MSAKNIDLVKWVIENLITLVVGIAACGILFYRVGALEAKVAIIEIDNKQLQVIAEDVKWLREAVSRLEAKK
jgi:hypothetical protein